jgi:hypothetical protein
MLRKKRPHYYPILTHCTSPWPMVNDRRIEDSSLKRGQENHGLNGGRIDSTICISMIIKMKINILEVSSFNLYVEITEKMIYLYSLG